MARRRGSTEGSIYRRRDGRWVASITVGTDARGRQRRRARYAKTRKEAAEKLRQMQSDTLNGCLGEPSRLKLGIYLERWLEDVSRPRTRATTHAEYQRLVRGHVLPHLAGVSIEKLGPLHLRGLQSLLEQSGVGARTRQAVHRLLHRSLGDAYRLGMLRANPVSAIDAPRVSRREIRMLDPDQTRRLLEFAREDRRLGPLAVILASTGLRIGEALALRWRDVDLGRGTLTVQHTLIEVAGRLSLSEPKTTKSRRQVELPGVALSALRTLRGRRTARPHPTAPLFADVRGGFLRRSNLMRRWWHPLLDRAGLRPASASTPYAMATRPPFSPPEQIRVPWPSAWGIVARASCSTSTAT